MTPQEKRDRELQRLELELMLLERTTANKIAKIRRRMERIKEYGKEEKRAAKE